MNVTDDQRIVTCAEHQFVIVVSPSRREMTSRGTPGHRVGGCAGCDNAVDEALTLCEKRPK